jgi:hypothetical protein
MCKDLDKFDKVENLKEEVIVAVADGHTTRATAVDQLGLKNVLYVPGLKKNLLSVQQLEKEGYSIIFQTGQVLIRDAEGTLTSIGVSDGHVPKLLQLTVYYLNSNVDQQSQTELTECNYDLWHKRLCHTNFRHLKEMIKSGVVEGVYQTNHQHVSIFANAVRWRR